MRHINIKTDGQMQQQTKQKNSNRKNNGQCNHYRFTKELDRYQKR